MSPATLATWYLPPPGVGESVLDKVVHVLRCWGNWESFQQANCKIQIKPQKWGAEAEPPHAAPPDAATKAAEDDGGAGGADGGGGGSGAKRAPCTSVHLSWSDEAGGRSSKP